MIDRLYSTYLNSTGVCTDTRSLKEGNLFIALKGPSFNANDFILRALEEGAIACVADEHRPEFESIEEIFVVEDGLKCLQDLASHHRKKLKIPIIGLTGSNGKTTTKELIHAALSPNYETFATRGNLNNHIGVPLSLLEIDRIKHDIAIIEMGANHQKEIEALCKIAQPDYGCITNIGLAHLEGFGGEEGVYKGKKELFDFISLNQGKVFVNSDDEKVVKASEGLQRYFYGTSDANHIIGQAITNGELLSVNWRRSGESSGHQVSTNLTGDYNLGNVLAAICIATYFGVEASEIIKGIEAYQPDNNRSQIENTERKNEVILDCYNANPSSMKVALENLAGIKTEKMKIAILGDMLELGDQSLQEHNLIIDQLVGMNLDQIFLVGPEFNASDFSKAEARHFQSTQDLFETLKTESPSNSIILLKGSRRMKLEQLFELL